MAAGSELPWNEAEVRFHRRICEENNGGNIWPLVLLGLVSRFVSYQIELQVNIAWI